MDFGCIPSICCQMFPNQTNAARHWYCCRLSPIEKPPFCSPPRHRRRKDKKRRKRRLHDGDDGEDLERDLEARAAREASKRQQDPFYDMQRMVEQQDRREATR